MNPLGRKHNTEAAKSNYSQISRESKIFAVSTLPISRFGSVASLPHLRRTQHSQHTQQMHQPFAPQLLILRFLCLCKLNDWQFCLLLKICSGSCAAQRERSQTFYWKYSFTYLLAYFIRILQKYYSNKLSNHQHFIIYWNVNNVF